MYNQRSPVLIAFLTYAIWIALMAAAGYVAWQWHGTTLAVAAWVISKPDLRPVGWNSGTLVAVQRLSVVFYGGLWLMVVMYMENSLRGAARDERLLRQSARFLLVFAAFGLVGIIIPLFLR